MSSVEFNVQPYNRVLLRLNSSDSIHVTATEKIKHFIPYENVLCDIVNETEYILNVQLYIEKIPWYIFTGYFNF